MNFEFLIAHRHLTHRPKTGFISLTSMISMGGVAVGVMALIVVLAVMSGFDRELKEKIVSVQPHMRLEKYGGLENPEGDIEKIKGQNIPGLTHVSAFVEGQAILRSEEDATGVIVKGIDVAREKLEIYGQHLIRGTLDFSEILTERKQRRLFFFKETIQDRKGAIFLGEILADRLGVGVGSIVFMISPFSEGGKTTFSLTQAETRPFVVKGIFRLGMNDFDSSLALISLQDAQAMYHLGEKVRGLSLRFDHVEDAQKWKHVLRGVFTDTYSLQSWYDMNHNFFQALKVEKSVMTILLALIILVAAFNIVATLTMTVMEKTRDIGILRALGATKGAIRRIFVIEGFSIGIFGVLAGTLFGVLLALNLDAVSQFLKDTTGLEVFPSDIYYLDRIPSEIHTGDIIVTVIFAMIACMAAGFYPAHRAASIEPIEALRYE